MVILNERSERFPIIFRIAKILRKDKVAYVIGNRFLNVKPAFMSPCSSAKIDCFLVSELQTAKREVFRIVRDIKGKLVSFFLDNIECHSKFYEPNYRGKWLMIRMKH